MKARAVLMICGHAIAVVVYSQSILNINGTAHSYMTCYSNGIDSLITYQDSASNYPILLRFCEGQMQACCDRVTIYDGLDVNAPVLYWGNGVNGDLTGLLVVSTNGDAALTVSITADSSISCMDQGYPTMKWVVYPDFFGSAELCVRWSPGSNRILGTYDRACTRMGSPQC